MSLSNLSEENKLQIKLYVTAKLEENKIGSDLIFVMVYGSHVYGLSTPTSDYDIYVVVEGSDINLDLHNEEEKDNQTKESDSDSGLEIDLTIRSMDLFKNSVMNGDPLEIELLYTPDEYVLVKTPTFEAFRSTFDFKSDEFKEIVRKGFSYKSSIAECRARKKFADGKVEIALKSQLHSYRILLYGVQIGMTGRIFDWKHNSIKEYRDELRSVPVSDLSERYFRDSTKKWLMQKTVQISEECSVTGSVTGSVTKQFKTVLPKKQINAKKK